ncbi:beta-galactosidase [Treponema zuelzerae]|uniref:Beta-galactosidase n=1 Tax=Teretinema zuelzerae TaxID=156 RepID=A0AAE3EKH2_9SPIR|nr:beta-galactosidase [Teretinema zuelzerae]MCD1655144.1 beta-galactosidase [Teretinema zuelzerae]
MDSYSYNPRYLEKNGEPWFPIMGEMHYSRFPADQWKESLLKMKAGGVDVVSTYVIWIHHEEVEGEWDFTGNRDLRRFVQTVGECGLSLMLRIGPWVHAEVRNGGFPDWLLARPFPVRSANDQRYFAEVDRLYKKIFSEVHGLMLKDGFAGAGAECSGPIIGVQIENEFGHCGGLSGEEGESHMRTLAGLAKAAGFDVPLYTATGWGGAVTGGMIPVMGGYCEAPWDQRLTDIEPSGNYIFTHERNDHNIGSDYGFGRGITFDLEKFPYLTAELGGGLQVTHHRRPIARSRDIGAMSLAKMGSGVNLLGYYMYHGGTNPKGKLTTLQETRDTGSINDLPELSYDFRAPIGEYGRISDTYREIKLLSLFLHDFGSDLCRMPARIPDENPLYPANRTELRHSWRCADGRGYLFINNFQRRQKQNDHAGRVFAAPGTDLSFPPLTVRDGEYFFLPFNMQIGSAVLETALATPLCVVEADGGLEYVFYTAFDQAEKLLKEGKAGELYRFKDGVLPADVRIRTLSRQEALDAWKVDGKLVMHSGELYQDGSDAYVDALGSATPVQFSLLWNEGGKTVYDIIVPEWTGDDAVLSLSYLGDSARLYEQGSLIADNFWLAPELNWDICLRRFGKGKAHRLRLEIQALAKDDRVFLETWPPMENGRACSLNAASMTPVRYVKL